MGYANTGGTTNCNTTVCFPTGSCVPELDSQNAAISWGPLTAANFQADYEVIAWSGAGVGTFSVGELVDATLPTWVGENQYPTDGELFVRQVAADNTSMVSNFSSWVPQVRCNHTSMNMHVQGKALCAPATHARQMIATSPLQPPHAGTSVSCLSVCNIGHDSLLRNAVCTSKLNCLQVYPCTCTKRLLLEAPMLSES